MLRKGRELQPTAKAFSLITLLRGLDIPELSSPELTGDWEFKLKQMERGQIKPARIHATDRGHDPRTSWPRPSGHESDTVPGDFGELKVALPEMRRRDQGELQEVPVPEVRFCLWKIVAGRQIEIPEIEELIAKRAGRPVAGIPQQDGQALRRRHQADARAQAGIRFRPEATPRTRPRRRASISPARSPWANAPSAARPFSRAAMSYICEKAGAASDGCDFRSGKIILQRPIEPQQVQKLLTTGKTDLLDKFISKKGRPFKAYLVVKEGRVGFEFEPRGEKKPKAADGKEAAPAPKVDFTAQKPVAKCPICGGRVFESESQYVCEKSQAEKKPCRFKSGKVVLGQPIDHAQLEKLVSHGRTDLLTKFISKHGKPFSAFLVLDDKKKVGFEFPPREESVGSEG